MKEMDEEYKKWFEEELVFLNDAKPSPCYTIDDIEPAENAKGKGDFGCFVFWHDNYHHYALYGSYENGKFYSHHVHNGKFDEQIERSEVEYFICYRNDDWYKEHPEEKKPGAKEPVGELQKEKKPMLSLEVSAKDGNQEKFTMNTNITKQQLERLKEFLTKLVMENIEQEK